MQLFYPYLFELDQLNLFLPLQKESLDLDRCCFLKS